MNESISASREKLIEDFKILSKDVQELIKATASVVSEKASEARTKVEDSLKVAQDKLAEVQDTVKDKGSQAVEAADVYVKQNPWQSVAIAAGTGFVVGISFALGALVRRR